MTLKAGHRQQSGRRSIGSQHGPFQVQAAYAAPTEIRDSNLDERSPAVASTFGVLDAIAFLVFAVLIAVATVIIVFLGQLPGRIARQRAHPQAAAINVAGWLGLATLGLLWPIALIWAFVSPTSVSPFASRSDRRGSEVDASAERRPPVYDPATIKQIRP